MARLIKKYKNRRLYDTDKSQYITVEELLQYVLAGIDFRVEDSVSNKDITNIILLQIIVEMESGNFGGSQFLSSEVLKLLIMFAHHPMNQYFKDMLEQMFKNMEKSLLMSPYNKDYKKSTDAWTQQMQQLLKHWQSFFKQ